MLRQLGVELERFGDATWIIRSLPETLAATDPVALVCALLAALPDAASGAARIDRALVGLARASGASGAAAGAAELLRRELRELDAAGLRLEQDALRVELSRGARQQGVGRRPVALRIGFDAVRRRLESGAEVAPSGPAAHGDGGADRAGE
jgi:hypothetical protein